MKKCSKCETEKALKEFHKDRQKKDGLCCKCKNCMREYSGENKEKIKQYKKEHYKENKAEINRKSKEYQKENRTRLLEQKREQSKEYRSENKEKIRQRQKEYRLNNLDKINEYFREKRKNDPQYRMITNLRTRNARGIVSKGGIKSDSTEKLLGCSFEYANAYIESLFENGMSWENYGEWEIDHIRPMSSFDLTDPEQQKLCCHYTNLQPLWAEENRSKNSLWSGIKH